MSATLFSFTLFRLNKQAQDSDGKFLNFGFDEKEGKSEEEG
jgi:hypothetical protein